MPQAASNLSLRVKAVLFAIQGHGATDLLLHQSAMTARPVASCAKLPFEGRGICLGLSDACISACRHAQ